MIMLFYLRQVCVFVPRRGCSTLIDISARLVLWMFDFIQTLPMEIEGVWSGRPSGTATIFLANRYCFGMSLILQLVIGSPVSATDKR